MVFAKMIGFIGCLAIMASVHTPVQAAKSDAPVISNEVKELTWIGFQQLKDASRIFIKTNEATRYHLSWKGDTKLILDLYNTQILVPNHKRPLDTQFFDSPVLLIKPKTIEDVSPTTRVEITVRMKAPYQVKQEDNLIFIDFRR